jgi:hypothetical protein
VAARDLCIAGIVQIGSKQARAALKPVPAQHGRE